MRFGASFAVAGLALMANAVAAVAPQKSVIVSYADDTPDSILAEAKAAIIGAGGYITHEYNLIKGFAATASEKALELVTTQGKMNNVLVEQDQIITANE